MARPHLHCEHAFGEFLRARRIPYVAVNEARKSPLPCERRAAASPADLALTSLKSFDFVVYAEPFNLLIDVKGRKFPVRHGRPVHRPRLENWVTEDDVHALAAWERLFGRGFQAAFVFMYWSDQQPPDGHYGEVFAHRNRWYILRAVRRAVYERHMRPRSPRWHTVDLPPDRFSEVCEPFACGALGRISA